MPLSKSQAQWTVIGRQVGSYVRPWYQHATSITEAGGWDEIAKAIASNFNNDDIARTSADKFTKAVQEDITRATSRQSTYVTLFRSYATLVIKDFLQSKNTTFLSSDFDDFGVNTQTGLIKDFIRGMVDNSTEQQYFLEHTVSYGIPTSLASNVHVGTTSNIVTNITTTQMLRTQRVTIECDDETPGSETFVVSGDITGNESVTAQVDTNYFGYKCGLNFRIDRKQTENNEGANHLNFLNTNRGESSSNTDVTSNANAMRLHMILWKNHAGSNELRVYSASNQIMHTNLATNLVMIGTIGTSGTMTLTASNSSGLSGTIITHSNINNAAGAATNIYYDLLRFRLHDAYFVTTTRSVEGRFTKFFTDALGIVPNVGTNNQVTIPDTLAGA